MKSMHAIALVAALAAAPLLHAQQGKSDYKLGERLPQSKPGAASQAYREVGWDALVPKNWDPSVLMKGIDLGQMSDNDPRAMEALQKMRKAWSEAPVDPGLNGAKVRIAGFLVPLDAERGQVKEFLLVPYFGACIHTPPPPANQIIHAVATRPLKAEQVMSAVWVSGTLETVRSETEFGAAGYRLKADVLTPYK
ncbi:MAG TPA: DUF3299 domain-containing protein [Noviherbaspirillum sp.]|jgi:hypothetical protein|uniref:DUF3299 domain-containing protein n=1 Tax=Noviherbaspirillum sp. TaxID=1926288 RepID=UPI002F94EC8C